MVPMVEEALDLDFSHRPIRPVLPVAGAVAHRIPRPASRAIAVTAIQKVLCIDGRSQRRTGQVHQCVCTRGNAEWPFRAVPLRYVTAPDQCSPVALRLQARRQRCEVGVQVDGVGVGRHLVDAAGRGFLPSVPAAVSTSAARHRDRSRHRGRVSAVAVLALPRRAVGCWWSDPTLGGGWSGLALRTLLSHGIAGMAHIDEEARIFVVARR
jgi:hypothetical protein